MTEVRRARRSDFIRVVTNGCDVCKPDNITIIPRYRIQDSLSDQVSRCNYCGREWDEFWICYAYVTKSLINQRQLKRGSRIVVMSDEDDCLLLNTSINS
jgi:hypothetical protein